MKVPEQPISLDEQVLMMKKYVSFRQRKRMKKFLEYTGYFRASRYGKYLLSRVGVLGSKSKQDLLFSIYDFDVSMRRLLAFYCNKVEVRFKSAISNAGSIYTNDAIFYLNKTYYSPSKGERDAKTKKDNIKYFNNTFFKSLKDKESKIRSDVMRYPELKEYRKGGSRASNKLPIWATFNYVEFGTATMMYNYLRGDIRKKVLIYAFSKTKYAKKDTELVDTWLDGVRNLRNYCAHNSMLIGMTSSIVLLDSNDDASILPDNTNLYSRLYALKKLLSKEDADNMKKEITKLIQHSSVDVYLMGILPANWVDMFEQICEF